MFKITRLIHNILSKRIDFKVWIILGFLSNMFMIGVLCFNIFIDPYLLFSHNTRFNILSYGSNERQEKTNRIYFNNNKDYNAILLGSSRATFVNQYEFKGMRLYNYAVSSMMPFEYKFYIDFMKQSLNKDLDYIILQIDFFGSNVPSEKILKEQDPVQFINTTTQPFYRLRAYFSLQTFKKYSLVVLKESLGFTQPFYHSYYFRNNVKIRKKATEEQRAKDFNFHLKRHTKELSDSYYKFNENLIMILQTIKQENKNSQFIVYTSPITANLLASIIRNANRWEEYKQWLKMHIEVFGSVWQFMGINSITTNLNNYPDDDHLYPEICTLMAHKITNYQIDKIPQDFGILLTKDNIDEYLENLADEIAKY